MTPVVHAATILQIIPRLDTGGAELSVVEMAEAVTRAGGRALVFTEGGRMVSDVKRAGGEIVTFPAGSKNPLRIILNGFRLARFVRRGGADLIHARSRAPAWSALIAARLTGVAFVTTYHGAYGNRGPLKPLYNSVMARGDRVIANSRYTGELISARHGTEEARIHIINRGVDLATFDPRAVSDARMKALREKWGVKESDRIVLLAARLTGWKGQDVMIDAAAQLQDRAGTADAVFVLAGDRQGHENHAAGLERQIRDLGLAGKVKLVGHCDDMPAAFLAAHVTVLPSREPEAFGRTSVEAQAMGSPVIVSDLGASPETLISMDRGGKEKATGWVVPPADASALAGAIAQALAMPQRSRAAMGERARAHVAAHFSSEQMKRETLAVYDALLRSALARSFADAAREKAEE